MIGALGRVLTIDKQIEELRSDIKRWTYRGRPTRRVRRLLALEERMNHGLAVSKMLLGRSQR